MSLKKTRPVSKPYRPIITSLYTLIALLPASVSYAENTQLVSVGYIKKSPETQKCYQSEYTVDEYKTVTNKIVSKQGSTSYTISHPSFKSSTTPSPQPLSP